MTIRHRHMWLILACVLAITGAIVFQCAGAILARNIFSLILGAVCSMLLFPRKKSQNSPGTENQITGLNLGKKDNMFQVKFILVAMMISSLTGLLLGDIEGLFLGLFLGLLGGCIVSGTTVMIRKRQSEN